MAKRKIQMTGNHLQAVQAHINQNSKTVPSPDPPLSTSSLGTDTQQRTTTSEQELHCNAAIVLLVSSCMFGNKRLTHKGIMLRARKWLVAALCELLEFHGFLNKIVMKCDPVTKLFQRL